MGGALSSTLSLKNDASPRLKRKKKEAERDPIGRAVWRSHGVRMARGGASRYNAAMTRARTLSSLILERHRPTG